MKLTRTFLGLSSAALALTAAIATVHYVAQAKENAPAINVDSKPVNRAEGSGNSYGPIVKKIAPSVVNIYSSRVVRQRTRRNPMLADPFFRQFFGSQLPDDTREYTRRDSWLGSGMIVTPDGYILTANHVVDGADEIKVSTSNDKTEYAAKIIGEDPETDIAVLKVEAHDLPAITLGDSSQLEVGDVVLAIGNPFGIGQTVTRGIVSALGRSLPVDDGETSANHYQDFIQTDASINMGNSGGALVDAEGRLVGINDAIVSPSGTSAGIGFAVPINLARNVMESFLNGGQVSRGWLGVGLQDVDAGLAKSFGVASSGGALVTDVGPNTPAARAGLKSGDVIVAVNGMDVSGEENLKVTISQLRPGTEANLKVVRNGVEMPLHVTLGTRPDFTPVSTRPSSSSPDSFKADALDGVFVQDLDSSFRQQLHPPLTIVGAVVTEVGNASNSYAAGLRQGDVIMEINRQPASTADDAVRLCKSAKTDQILVKVWRQNGTGEGSVRYVSVDNTKPAK